jgi:four helix bundle protein
MARDHTKLRTFKLADDLVAEVYQISRTLPPEERFGLQSQIRRAAVSIPTNIVEGAVRRSEPHCVGYLETSLGSACEARYLLQLCIRLQMLDARHCESLIARYTDVIQGLAALISRIDQDLADEGRPRQAPTRRR